jgi:two-component system sensor histidine kinase/response regulator
MDEGSWHRMKILVIEDDATIRTEVLDWLEFEGYSVIGSENGKAGVQVALEQVPDLIISDINMPEMNGQRVLIELRSHPATSLIPFIFLTASTGRDDVRRGMELGAEDYITKPFTNAELIGAVKVQLAKAATFRKHSDAQMDELRAALIHTLPHELRTPLCSILGYGELLVTDADYVSPDDVREMAASIVSSGQRLRRLILKYLLYAQIEIEANDPQKSATYSEGHVDEPDFTVAQFSQEVAYRYKRDTNLRLDLHGSRTARITGPDLGRIMEELVDNAFKFSPPDSLVTVTTKSLEDAYEIQIVDCGRGLNPEDISRIGAYIQFGRTLHEQQGTGIGLIIAKRLIERYGGSLDIQSRLDNGATVSIQLLND